MDANPREPDEQEADDLERTALPEEGSPENVRPAISVLYALAGRWGALRATSWFAAPRHARPLRATVARIPLLAVVLVLLVGGDGAAPVALAFPSGHALPLVSRADATPAVTISRRAPAQDRREGWQEIALPPGAEGESQLAPSAQVPNTLYVCAQTPPDLAAAHPAFGASILWRTRDAGATWTSLGLPPLPGSYCQVSVSTQTDSRVAVLSANQLFLSDDGGDHWMHPALPAFQLGSDSLLFYDLTVTAHDIFVGAEYDHFVPGAQQWMQVIALDRMSDDSDTWVRVGQVLGANMLYRPFSAGDENTLIASVVSWGGPPVSPSVWLSHDAGTTWSDLHTTNAPFTTNLVTLPIAAAPPAPVYAMIDEQVPSYLFRLKASELDPGASSWVSLPPLPVPGASPTRTGLFQLYVETDDGRLLAFGVGPQASVPSEEAMRSGDGTTHAQQWLWIWDPRVGRWLVWPTPLSVTYAWGCGVCLYHAATWGTGPAKGGRTASGTYLWLHQAADSPDLGFGDAHVAYRLFVPDAPPGELSAG